VSLQVQFLRSEEAYPSLVSFLREYVPPRKPKKKQVKLQKEVNYDMVTLVIPLGVTVEGDMLGTIGNLRYSNHDLENLNKIPKLAPKNHLHIGMNPRSHVIKVEMKEWET
jgi:hypothetical protein